MKRLWAAQPVLLLTVAIGTAVFGAPVQAANVPMYQGVDLGTLGGQWSEAVALNDRDEVVGSSRTATGEIHPFLWRDGHMIDLGALPGSTLGYARDINERGQVIGISLTDEGTHGFLWDRGVMTDLGVLGMAGNQPSAINNRGQIVGSRSVPSGASAFAWHRGVMRDLGFGLADAADINDHAQIVGGSSFGGTYESHAYVLQRGRLIDLDRGSPDPSWAYAINERGWATGIAVTNFVIHAVLWRDGARVELNLPGQASWAADLNDRGQVLGWGSDGETVHPYLWQGGRVTDLTTRGLPAGLVLNPQADINNRGHLTVSVDQGGSGHATLFR